MGHSGMRKRKSDYRQQREEEGWGREVETCKMAEIYQDKNQVGGHLNKEPNKL